MAFFIALLMSAGVMAQSQIPLAEPTYQYEWACAPPDSSDVEKYTSCTDYSGFLFDETPCTTIESSIRRSVKCMARPGDGTTGTGTSFEEDAKCESTQKPEDSISNRCKYEYKCKNQDKYVNCNYCSSGNARPAGETCVQPDQATADAWVSVEGKELHFCYQFPDLLQCEYSWFCAATGAPTESLASCSATPADYTGYSVPEGYSGGCVTKPTQRQVKCMQYQPKTEKSDMIFVGEAAEEALCATDKPATALPDCVYEWKCAVKTADTTTYVPCTDDAFTCQSTAEPPSQCFSGLLTRTVACVDQDGKPAAANSECPADDKPAETGNACQVTDGCKANWVCTATETDLVTEVTECKKDDVKTGFPLCGKFEEPVKRAVRCMGSVGENVVPLDGKCDDDAKPVEKIAATEVLECSDWVKKEGECLPLDKPVACYKGNRNDIFECPAGKVCDPAAKPQDEAVPCDFDATTCPYRYVCLTNDVNDEVIKDLTEDELSCEASPRFMPADTRKCFKDRSFDRQVICYDGEKKTKAAEDTLCAEQEKPSSEVTLSFEEECKYIARCVPVDAADAQPEDSAFLPAAACESDDADVVAKTFGECVVECAVAWTRRAAKCVSELGAVVDDDKCDNGTEETQGKGLSGIVTRKSCVTAPALTLSTQADTLTVGSNVDLEWCLYPGNNTAPLTATISLSSVAEVFPVTTIATLDPVAESKRTVALPIVAPATDAVLSIAIEALNLTTSVAARRLRSLCEANENYCGEHGQCLPPTSTCKCDANYLGDKCEVDACDAAKCKSDFTDTCVVEKAPKCKCKSTFYGDTCERNEKCDDNASLKCLNGGFVGVNDEGACKSTCTCLGDWAGDSCAQCNRSCDKRRKADAACAACECLRGLAGEDCRCRQTFGTLLFGNVLESTIGETAWRNELREDIAKFIGLSVESVAVTVLGKKADGKTHIIISLTSDKCGSEPTGLLAKLSQSLSASRTKFVKIAGDDDIDTSVPVDLYTKWKAIVADLKKDSKTSELKKEGYAFRIIEKEGGSVTAASAVYDPICVGDGCSTGVNPFEEQKDDGKVPDNSTDGGSAGIDGVTTIVILAVTFGLAIVIAVVVAAYRRSKQQRGYLNVQTTQLTDFAFDSEF